MTDLSIVPAFRGRFLVYAFWVVLICTGCRSTKAPAIAIKPRVVVPYVDGPGVAEPIADPAEICFADTHFYARFMGLAGHNKPGVNPFAAQAAELITELNAAGLVDRGAAVFGDSREQLFNRFFGTDVALVDRAHPRRSPLLVMSKAAPKDIKRLPGALDVEPWPEAPTNGGYPTYVVPVSGGNELLLALGTNWFFLCDKKHGKALRELLRAQQEPRQGLATLPEYVRFRDGAPASAFGFAFARAKSQDYHGAAISASDSGYTVDVASVVERPAPAGGDMPYPFLGQLHDLDFGPLPESTVAAASINVVHRQLKDLGILDIPLIFSSVRSKILPGVHPPLIGVVGEVPMPEVSDTATAPALAVCARVTDKSVANALDSMIRTFQFLSSLGAMDFSRTLFGFKKRSFDGVSYKVADFGDGIIGRLPEGPLLPLVDLPEPAGLRELTIGRIGDWYLICSQEAFFKACITAAHDPTKRWMASPKFAEFAITQQPELIASFAVDASRAASVVQSAGDIYEGARAAKEKSSSKKIVASAGDTVRHKPEAPLKRLDELMHVVSDVAHQVSEGWLHMHTAPTEAPKPKKKSTIGKKKRKESTAQPAPVAETKRALRPLRWVSDALGRHHSFAAQFWRNKDGDPQGTIRFLTDQRAAGPSKPAGAFRSSLPQAGVPLDPIDLPANQSR